MCSVEGWSRCEIRYGGVIKCGPDYSVVIVRESEQVMAAPTSFLIMKSAAPGIGRAPWAFILGVKAKKNRLFYL